MIQETTFDMNAVTQGTLEPLQLPTGPITCQRAKKITDAIAGPEFAYNRCIHPSSFYLPYKIDSDSNSLTPMDLLSLIVIKLGSMNDKGKAELVRIIGFQCIVFDPGNWVWLYMQEETIQVATKSRWSISSLVADQRQYLQS